MSENLPILLRRGIASDLAFIRNSWLRNYHEHGEGARHVPNDVFFANNGHWGVVDRCLREGQTIVATTEGDDSILGWACWLIRSDVAAVHYVYVKAPFRRLGIASQLLTAGPAVQVCTHFTRAAKDWLRLIYNPYLLERAP